ncbi:MAG: glycerate kinase [Pigmentiphaga sp.]|nr:glycerate kinase [Pigmentiphaga sp.]
MPAPQIVVAPDSFKGSLSASRVADAIARGLQHGWPGASVRCVPMADGGEGTVAAMLAATGGERRLATVSGPLGKPVTAVWGLLPGGWAVVELAEAAGLPLLADAERDAGRACTHGVGELIRAALDAGASRILLALGGSATTDGGAGMLRALGARLLDAEGQPVPPGGAALASLRRLDLSGLDPRLKTATLEVACDVDNPLCGERGAAAVFGPQKGATPAEVAELDEALAHWAGMVAAATGQDRRDEPGAGAAGGAAFGALVLGGALVPGVDRVAQWVGLPRALAGADWVLTGEGRLDAQTLGGKVPAGVLRLARERGVPVVAICGSLAPGYEALYEEGLAAAFSLVPGPATLEQACAEAEGWLERRARDVSRLLAAGSRGHLSQTATEGVASSPESCDDPASQPMRA